MHRFRYILYPVLILLVYGCATPMGPTGGEPDRSGPEIVNTSPENGTTNFNGDEIRFEFNEFVDRNSFRQNVSIEPDLAIELDYGFRRKTAIVKFQGDLPENTTVVVKVGVDVTDTDRNKMNETYDFALSTGDVLDSGEVNATVFDANTGRGESGRRVFLYRMPADLSARANYVAQSDTAGNIKFSYLSEGEYRAFWVEDLNRNRIWDQGRESAQPFSENIFRLEQDSVINLGTLYYAIPDTISPVIEGVGLLSERRLRLRLSETVTWESDAYLSVADTLGDEHTLAYPLYLSETDQNVLFAQSEDAISADDSYTLQPFGISDDAGNDLEINFEPFAGSSEPDTTALKTVSHNSGNGLFPDEPLEITYTKFIDDDSVIDSLLVFEGDRMINDWPAVEADRHILRIMPGDELWESGVRYEFRVWNPWTLERESINPEIWQQNELGGIELQIENAEREESRKRIQLRDTDNSISVDTTITGNGPLLLDNLPPLDYRLTIYEDLDDNGMWNQGTIQPYSRPEPYLVRRNIPVREGFTSEVTLQFPLASEAEQDENTSDNPPESNGHSNYR